MPRGLCVRLSNGWNVLVAAEDAEAVAELDRLRQLTIDTYPRFEAGMMVRDAERQIAAWRAAVAAYDAHVDAWRASRRPVLRRVS